MTNTTVGQKRAAVRKEFSGWRKKKGLSYQAIVETVNPIAIARGIGSVQEPPLKYPTVASWGTRGHVPSGLKAKALSLVYPDCPLLKGIHLRP